MSRTVWTVIGVVVAVIIAWFLVDVLFSLLWFIGKLAIVAVVAVIVFLVLRSAGSRDARRGRTAPHSTPWVLRHRVPIASTFTRAVSADTATGARNASGNLPAGPMSGTTSCTAMNKR